MNMHFTRIKLSNWRNFKNAETKLASRAIFVGPNASGKSNLIDALRFLRDLVVPGGGLGAAIERRQGVSALRCLQATRNSDISIEVDVGSESQPSMWTYALSFNAKRGSAPEIKSEIIRRDGNIIHRRPDNEDKKDTLLLTQTHIQQVNQNKQFRELAEFLATTRYLHVVPQIIRDRRRAITNESDPYGGDFLTKVKSTSKRSRDALLKRINDGLRIAVPQFDGLEYKDDDEGRPHLYAKYHHWRPYPVGQSEELFSDGTLGLIGFLWAIGERELGPLLLEEPELSLHDAIVEQLITIIARMQKRSGRQVLMTTHSEILLNAPGLGLNEVHRLVPTDNGTIIETADDNSRVRHLVENGLELGSAVMPEVRPNSIEQLSLFDVSTD